MENRGNRTSEELAKAKEELYGFPLSSRATRNAPDQTLSDPAIQIGFEGDLDVFQPGDFLKCEFVVTLEPEHQIQAIESSVIWLTEGKGDSDIGVHFFERRQKQTLNADTFKQPQRICTVLPASPLSYEGLTVKIRWCVRVRLFLTDGRQVTQDQYFQLGNVRPISQVKSDQTLASEPDSESGPAAQPTESIDNDADTGAA